MPNKSSIATNWSKNFKPDIFVNHLSVESCRVSVFDLCALSLNMVCKHTLTHAYLRVFPKLTRTSGICRWGGSWTVVTFGFQAFHSLHDGGHFSDINYAIIINVVQLENPSQFGLLGLTRGWKSIVGKNKLTGEKLHGKNILPISMASRNSLKSKKPFPSESNILMICLLNLSPSPKKIISRNSF